MMSSTKKVLIKPIIISHDRKMLLPPQKLTSSVHFPKVKLSNNIRVYTEEVIYESKNCDFLKGESQEVLIVNRLNLVNKTCRTIAKCTSKGVSVETTSDDVCSLIGQKNYDTVLSALSSIFNEETKVRGILALLKPQTKHNSISTQANIWKSDSVEISSQTDESMLNYFLKQKQRKRIRKSQVSAYVVKDSPPRVKKCIINIDDVKKEPKDEVKDIENPLPHLDFDNDSNFSIGSCTSISSFPSLSGALDRTEELLSAVEKATVKDKPVNPTVIKVLDGSSVMIPNKPEDHFHMATPEILKHVTKDERTKLIQFQAYIDSKMCMEQDEDGYYPLHAAVLNDEAVLVRRQCVALRMRGESVDILAGGMTALNMAIRQDKSEACINGLLYFGADPLLCDADGRTSLHHCADSTVRTLRCVINYCDKHARRVLQNNGELWKPELESKADLELVKYLYDKVAEMFDDQGYTPLMIAAAAARPDHVALLSSRAPSRVDVPARSGGDTALYRAVAAACLHTRDSNNRSLVPENFLKTVEILVEHGADPTIENHSNSSVNTLLTEFNISSLSMTIANKMNSLTHRKLASNMMLYKDADGIIGYKNINGLKEINSKDVKNPASLGSDIANGVTDDKQDNSVLKAIIAVDVGSKKGGKNAKKEIGIKKIVKKFTIVTPKDVKSDVLVKNAVKEAGVKVMRPTGKLILKDNFRIKEESDKVIIVENVKVDKDVFPKLTAVGSTTVVSKPKDIVIKSPVGRKVPRKQSFVKIAQKVDTKSPQMRKQSYVKIAPKPTVDIINCKKRKPNELV